MEDLDVRFRGISLEWRTILFYNDYILVGISDINRGEYGGAGNDD
jgi:hypothetical protein